MRLSVLAALAEPTRLGAMRLPGDRAEHCVCALIARLGPSQSRMSRHLKGLRDAGLVPDRRDAQWVRYRRNLDLAPDLRAMVVAIAAFESRAAAAFARVG